jgi:TnpA family transposase
MHPTYQAFLELGKARRTVFLCSYLHDKTVRQEVQGGLNVIENWNSANSFIYFGKSGEIASNNPEEQELAVLSLHLLQICLVYINTLMLQQIWQEQAWGERLETEDLRALTPLFYTHVNPYGEFRLDMHQQLDIA